MAVRTYDYIPFPELRRQYRQEKKHRKTTFQLLKWSAWAITYGIIAGMLAVGFWVIF